MIIKSDNMKQLDKIACVVFLILFASEMFNANSIAIIPKYTLSGSNIIVSFTQMPNQTLNYSQIEHIFSENLTITNITTSANTLTLLGSNKTITSISSPAFDKLNLNKTCQNGSPAFISSLFNLTIRCPPQVLYSNALNSSTSGLWFKSIIIPNVTISIAVKPISHVQLSITSGEGIQNINNVTIIPPKSILINKTFAPMNAIQFYNFTNETNDSIRIKVEPLQSCVINKIITPVWNESQIFENSTYPCDYNFSVLRIPALNKTITLNSGNTFSNSTIGLNINVPIPNLKINKTLGFSDMYRNNTYNITFSTPSITPTVLEENANALSSYYDNISTVGCAEYQSIRFMSSNTGQNETSNICVRKTNSTISIYNICEQLSLLTNNWTQGLGQCILTAFKDDNTSAIYWKNMYNSSQQTVFTEQKTIGNLTQTNDQLQNGSNYSFMLSGAFVLVVASIFIADMYFSNKKKNLALNK